MLRDGQWRGGELDDLPRGRYILASARLTEGVFMLGGWDTEGVIIICQVSRDIEGVNVIFQLSRDIEGVNVISQVCRDIEGVIINR